MNDPIIDLTIRFLINSIMLFIIARWLYFRISNKKQFLFSILIIGTTVFFLCYLLSSINLELGLALGLFAIFGILRYRSLPVAVRDMTYIFLAITISVINSLTAAGYPAGIILAVNLVILMITAGAEFAFIRRMDDSMPIKYEKIELVTPDRHEELIADLEARLGMSITDVRIKEVNFLNDTAELQVFFDNRKHGSRYTDSASY